jgi:hypothetical protein
MLERMLKLMLVLTLLFFLVQCVIGLFFRVLGSFLTAFGAGVGAIGSIFTGLLALVGFFCLTAGLFVRARRLVMNRDPRAARDRAARECAVRTRVRRSAEGAPVHEPPPPAEDPDPAINEDEEEGE